ncbi:MAG: DUF1854 domain-containing protein [Gemmatimonadota bacterium]
MSDPEAAPATPADKNLDPAQVRFARTRRGQLQMTVAGQAYEEVRLRRAFPLEIPDRYLGFFLPDGSEVGLLASPDGLDEESRKVLTAELERTYFLPVITAVGKIGEEFGVVHADVETTSGPRQIEIRGIRSSIRVLSRQRALVEDATGNRYELRDYHRLSKLTREILGL